MKIRNVKPMLASLPAEMTLSNSLLDNRLASNIQKDSVNDSSYFVCIRLCCVENTDMSVGS